ncbi:response regulator [Microbacterium radiodurans]|uniref:Transcriptional regulatory protein n=1 Tax=Microbacterium radiodurans TaxID=661398 RepID=A0A5J5IVH4_9MICO|nr:response regulator [Microbacterium radiodurans]KAA9087294.1 response regulator [Microbacterium radiodurans]
MIGVLLVDDEALTLDLHREYVGRLDGFRVIAECSGARSALRALLDSPAAAEIDLVLLDMTMPDGSGLDVLRHLRARARGVDVIAITSVREADVVRQAVSLGAVQYLVKPFTFADFRERMTQYARFRERASETTGTTTQAEIDAMFGALRPTTATIPTPKGLSPETLERVSAQLRAGGALSAREAAERLGMSRVAARRYLEHLADAGRAARDQRYGTPGRPETEYRWRS